MNTDINFPSGNPLDPSGNLNPQWRMFFLTLFTRSGGVGGNDTSALQTAIEKANASIADLGVEGAQGHPTPDMAAVVGLIHAVEAIAAQAMAAASRQPDERGEIGESASVSHLSRRVAELEGQLEHYRADDALRSRIADLEAKIDAISSPQFTDTGHLTNGAGFLVAANNLSDVGAAATARTNIGLGSTNAPTFAGVTSTSQVSAIAPSSGSIYGVTAARNGAPEQSIGLGGTSSANQIDAFSSPSNAKPTWFNSTTDSSNTTPTAGSVGFQWKTLGSVRMTLTQSGNLLVGTTTDDGSGNPIQSNAGLSIKPATTTTAPAAGAAGALPATPTGYATIRIGGTDRKIAYY